MSSSKGFYAGSIILLACALIGFGFDSSFAKQAGQGQSAKASTEGSASGQSLSIERLSATAKPAPEAASAVSTSAAFASAALRNAQLQTNLGWVFGGKAQRGWQLYTPLISSMIGADTDGQANDFAARLSQWQKENGIEASGAWEDSTWSQMDSTLL